MNEISLYLNGMFALRLLIAGMLGFAIGIDREYRAKEAGVRTHFLVAMGSCLIMIVSQFGFGDAEAHGDPGRLAAQIVSGIGFIGAGTIMVHKQAVRGLTTAAGLWVSAGIGMAVGGGLYLVGVIGTVLALIGMEILPLVTRKLKVRTTTLTFTTSNKNNLMLVTDMLNQQKYKISRYSVSAAKDDPEKIRVQVILNAHEHFDENKLLLEMEQFQDIRVDKIE